jgi:uncharacterized protein YsxB (DUF464 family)
MIKISVEKNGSKFSKLEAKGHASSAPYGEDLVCAAVSAVLTGGFNSISDKNSFLIKLDEGHALLESKETVSTHDEVVIETIVTSLKTIADSNSKYIQINFKERKSSL